VDLKISRIEWKLLSTVEVIYSRCHKNVPKDLKATGTSGQTLCGIYDLRQLEHRDCGFESHWNNICMSTFFCVVLCCNRLWPCNGPVWSVRRRTKILEGFIVSEVNSESEQARGSNTRNVTTQQEDSKLRNGPFSLKYSGHCNKAKWT
jgi:hypothetical protein